jgi:glycosyltransferase involved in cell wall biosynthesis
VVGAAGADRQREAAGLMVDPADAAGLADALGRLLTDRPFAAALAARGLARAHRFTWDRAAERMQAIFREVLAAQADAFTSR